MAIFYFKSEATQDNGISKDRFFQVHMNLKDKTFSLFEQQNICLKDIFERPPIPSYDDDETEEERLFRLMQDELDFEGEEEPLEYEFPLGRDEKVYICFHGICPDVRVKVRNDQLTYDRVTSSYWEWYDTVPITEEEYQKELFKAELMALLKRYNQKYIGQKGTLTQRIQRLFKKHFGSSIPPIRIGDLG
jgi:hypothetical protein